MIKLLKFSNGPQNSRPVREQGQYYERRGRQVTRQIARAVAQKSWKWTLVNLAWTAGPVTYLGLQVGSLVGLGKLASSQTFIYFAVYTVVAAGLAAISSIYYDAFHHPRVKHEQARLLRMVDKLHNLLLATRNAMLEQLDPDARRIMGAYYLLSSSGVTPSAVGTAVEDLTQNAKIAKFARRIDVFSEQGMESRIQDEWERLGPLMDEVREQLETIAPLAFQLLQERLRGIAPNAQNGLERSDGFIERCLSAAENENPERMTLHDAYEMLVLGFEMLNGRCIAMFDVRFEGDEALERAQSEYDEALQHYRKALRARNNQIRLLAEQLTIESDADAVADAADTVGQLIRMIERGIAQLSEDECEQYRTFYEQRILRLQRQAFHRYQILVRAEKTYRRAWERYGHDLTLSFKEKSLHKSGFIVEEHDIVLADNEKIRFSHQIETLLEDVEIRTGRSLMVFDTSHENRMMKFVADDYKHLAMGMAHLLDDLINISQPEEQMAVESSNMANLGSIDIDLTPQTKAGWASAMVDALHKNRRKASQRLARSLVQFYRVPLQEEMIDYFVNHFGADRHYLDQLNLELESFTKEEKANLPAEPHKLRSWHSLCEKAAA